MALNRQQRASDSFAFSFDVEAAKFGAEPNIVPLPKSAIDIGVVFGQAPSQIAAFKRNTCLRDRSDADVFHKQMRGHHDAGSGFELRSMQKRNRAAIGMAEQHGLLNAQQAQQLGQHLVGFMVHVIGPQFACAAHIGHSIGLPIATP